MSSSIRGYYNNNEMLFYSILYIEFYTIYIVYYKLFYRNRFDPSNGIYTFVRSAHSKPTFH